MYVDGCGLVRAKKLLRVESLLKTWPTFPRALRILCTIQKKYNFCLASKVEFTVIRYTFGLNFPEFIKRFSAFLTFL